ncbi:hypothetical protein RND71_003145 [Anisodus tanguticus]|uniref:Uncharacterized protein n=1 Tax=Anisodus tanguticus TaxID=243964 RepID=A0AAE1SVX4_9SOLA|nr:hypothetical protein RND71_003145 [Anisodus tanguticus]
MEADLNSLAPLTPTQNSHNKQSKKKQERKSKMADKEGKGKGKAEMAGSGESKNGVFPFTPKKGSLIPKEKKHVSTMMGEKIGHSIVSFVKINKNKINPDGHPSS